MTVQLWYQSSDVMPGGFYATYNTADEALAQAIADIHVGRVPGPDRIVAEDGSVVDRKTILEAATPTVDVPPAVE